MGEINDDYEMKMNKNFYVNKNLKLRFKNTTYPQEISLNAD